MNIERSGNPDIVNVQIADIDEFLTTLYLQNEASNPEYDVLDDSWITLYIQQDEDSEASTIVRLQKEEFTDAWIITYNQAKNKNQEQIQKRNKHYTTINISTTECSEIFKGNKANIQNNIETQINTESKNTKIAQRREYNDSSHIIKVEQQKCKDLYLIYDKQECNKHPNTIKIKQQCPESSNIIEDQTEKTSTNRQPNMNNVQRFSHFEGIHTQNMNQTRPLPSPLQEVLRFPPANSKPAPLAHQVVQDDNPNIYRHPSEMPPKIPPYWAYRRMPVQYYHPRIYNPWYFQELHRMPIQMQNNCSYPRYPIQQGYYMPMQTRMPYAGPQFIPNRNTRFPHALHMIYRPPIRRSYRRMFRHTPRNPWIPKTPRPIVPISGNRNYYPAVNMKVAHQVCMQTRARAINVPKKFPEENYVQAHKPSKQVYPLIQFSKADKNGKYYLQSIF